MTKKTDAQSQAPAPVLIERANLADGSIADLLIVDSKFVSVSTEAITEVPEDTVRIDAHGLIALPGLVDLHTHLREPGGEGSENFLSGTRVAAAGGFTTVFAMANTQPVTDSAARVEWVAARAGMSPYAKVRPIGAVTRGLSGEQLADLGGMRASRAKVRVFSDDGMCVWDKQLMREALQFARSTRSVIAQHAQDPALTRGALMNEGQVSADLGLVGWPTRAEVDIIKRDLQLAKQTGGHVHICHLSTAESIEVVRWAKSKRIRVTAEATPHHLLFTDESVRGYDTRFKVNPPLRSAEDVQALRLAVADGTVDIVATDHAPHQDELKHCEFAHAANGMIGLESALSVVQHTLVDEGHLDWSGVAKVMSQTPAQIGKLRWRGLTAGAVADLVLMDPKATHTQSQADIVSRSSNSPYLGLELPGQVQHTFTNGLATVRNGQVIDGLERQLTEGE